MVVAAMAVLLVEVLCFEGGGVNIVCGDFCLFVYSGGGGDCGGDCGGGSC